MAALPRGKKGGDLRLSEGGWPKEKEVNVKKGMALLSL